MGATDRSGIDTALHRLVLESATDPGPIGAGRGWLDTSGAAPVLKIRNADDSGWNDISASWVLVEADAAGSPYTPTGGTNTWFRVNTTAGPVTINNAVAPVEGDQIMVTPLDSVNPVNYPWTGEVLVGQTSLARYDGVHAFYAPVLWSDFLGRARGAGLTDSGTAIAVDIGTTAGKVLALDVAGKIPAVDGSQLLNLAGGTPTSISNGGGSVAIDGAGAIVLDPGGGQGVNVMGALVATAVSGNGSGLTGLPASGLVRSTVGNAADPNTFDGSSSLVAPVGALKKVTLAAPGLVLGISFGVFEAVIPQRYNAVIQAADNAGGPGVALSSGVSALLGDGNGDTTFRWVSVPVAPVWLPAGDYWIGGGSDITGTSMTLLWKNGGTDQTMTGVDVGGAASIRSGAGLTLTVHKFFIYANVLS